MSIVSRILLKSEADTTGVSRMSQAVSAFRRDLSGANSTFFRETERTLSGFNRAVLGIRTGLLQTAGGFILGNLITDATNAVIGFGKSFIDVGSQVQQFKLQFTNIFKTLGLSAEEAGQQAENAFNFAKEVARTTPFDLPQITQAILRMETFGISVHENLGLAIDLASALGEGLDEVTRAFTNLQSRRFGEAFEQFARFGIARDLLEAKGLKFDANGSYEGSVKDAMDAIQEIIRERFGGFAETQQGTFKQLQSNLRDIVFQLKEAFGAPIFAGVNEDLNDFVGALSDNQSQIEAFAFAFGELFEGARTTFNDSIKSILSDLQGGGEVGPEQFLEYGTNLMVAFAEGLLEGAKFVLEAAIEIANGIAFFFEAFSPPKGGPLRDIDVWGANLMNTFLEGFGDADLSILTDVLDMVKSQFDALVDSGFLDTETPKQDFLELVDIILNGFNDIAAGGDAANAVFRELAAVIGDAAFAMEELVAISQEIASLQIDLGFAQDALDTFDASADAAEQALMDQIEAAIEADRVRREAFDAANEAADEAADAASDAAKSAGDGAQAASDAAKEAIEDQIDALEDQIDLIEENADAAVELVKAEEKAQLALLDSAADALEAGAQAAQRALEDFNFQTEGIPERFTRQRRRELERIATLKKREAEDGKKAIDDEKKRIKENADLRIKGIKDAAELQKKALKAEIEALRERTEEINRAARAEGRVNAERKRKPKFVPDPRIKELKDQLDKLRDINKAERDNLQDRIDDIRKELAEKKLAAAEIKAGLQAQLDILKLIGEANKEQITDAKALKTELDKIKLEPPDRVNDFFDKEALLGDIEEAKAKLRELIPQSVRDDLKKDIQFFAEFFKGLVGIDSSSQGDGFTQGKELNEAFKRIGTSFKNDILPNIILIKDAFFATLGFAKDLADIFDRLKAPIAGGLSAILEFVGLRDVPVIKQIVDFLEKPLSQELATIGGILLFLKLTPGLSPSIVFKFSVVLAGLAARIIPWLIMLLTGGAFGGAGGGALAGAGGALAGAAIPILIALAVILAISVVLALATDFKGIRSRIIDFIKDNPVITAALLALPGFNVIIPLAIFFEFLADPLGNLQKALEPITDFFEDLDFGFLGFLGTAGKTIGDFFGDIGDALGGFPPPPPPGSGGVVGFFQEIGDAIGGISGILGGAGRTVLDFFIDLGKTIGAPFVAALTASGNALRPWSKALETIFKLQVALFTLPFKIFLDLIETVMVPLFLGPAKIALEGLKTVFDNTLGKLPGVLGPAYNEIQSFATKTTGKLGELGGTVPTLIGLAFNGITSIVSTAFGTAFGAANTLISGFVATISVIFAPMLGAIGSIFGQIGGIIAGAFSGLLSIVSPPVTALVQGILGILGTLGTGIGVIVSNVIAPAVNGILGIFQGIVGPLTSIVTGYLAIITAPFAAAINFLTSNFIPFFLTTLPNAITGIAGVVSSILNSKFITDPFETAQNWLTNTFAPFIGNTVPGFFRILKTGIVTLFTEGGSFITAPFEAAVDFFRDKFIPYLNDKVPGALSTFSEKVGGALSGFASGLSTAASGAVTAVSGLPGKLSNAVGNGTQVFMNFGRGLVQGLVDGITGIFGQLVTWVDNIIQQLARIPAFLRPGSPSKTMMELGRGAVEGLALGLKQREPQLRSEVEGVIGILANMDTLPTLGNGAAFAGEVAAKEFTSSFLGVVEAEFARNPALKAFLQATVNNISVNVEGRAEQVVKAKSPTEAANVVSKILRQSA